MKKQKVLPFPRKKKTQKAPEWKVFEFSALLEEAAERYDRAIDARKKADHSEKDGRQEEAKQPLPASGKKNDSRPLH